MQVDLYPELCSDRLWSGEPNIQLKQHTGEVVHGRAFPNGSGRFLVFKVVVELGVNGLRGIGGAFIGVSSVGAGETNTGFLCGADNTIAPKADPSVYRGWRYLCIS